VVENIGKSFRGRPVVKGVSLTLSRGEVAGLLGPNGAGKTTCFYMITGLIPVDYGSIYLDGENITEQPMYQRARMGVGYLPQETSIFRGMTVEQNVMAVVELRERDARKAQGTVTELLEELHIEHLRNAPANSLSGGERRRVEIARALASEPSFMLLDEPFAGIDPLAIADIREVIAYLKERGIGILITDHNVRETLEIIDRASIIHAGELLFEGTPEQAVEDPEVRRVYLGDRYG
jgi:lipopolysaccharide export system ATP-binding protein